MLQHELPKNYAKWKPWVKNVFSASMYLQMSKTGKSIRDSRADYWLPRRGNDDWAQQAPGSFGKMETSYNWIVVMVTQLCKFTKICWIAYLKWVDFMACKVNFHTADCLELIYFLSSLSWIMCIVPGKNNHLREYGSSRFPNYPGNAQHSPSRKLWWATEDGHWSICQIPRKGSLKRVKGQGA